MKIFLVLMLMGGSFLYAGNMPNIASKDPGFENIRGNWFFIRPSDCATIQPGEGIGNSKALVIESKDDAPVKRAGLFRNGFIPVEAGKTYTVEAKFKSAIRTGHASVKIHMWKGCDGEKQDKNSSHMTFFESERIDCPTDEKWATVYKTFTVPEGANGAHLELSANDMTGKIIFDDIKMTEDNGALKLPLLAEAPVLDGKLSPSMAANSLKCIDFMKYPLHEKQLEKDQTIVYMAMTNNALIVTALLYHDPDSPLKGEIRPRDGSVWSDDGIEFFITHTNAERPYYHFIINCKGSIYDAIESNRNWTSKIVTAVGKPSEDCSIIQFSLPLSDIGYNRELDAHIPELNWQVNIARCHTGRENNSITYSTWSKVRTFPDSSNYTPVKGLMNGKARTVSNRFRSSGAVSSKAAGQRFWPIAEPMYEELISNQPNPLKGESAFIWPRPLETRNNINFALQYGMEYTLEKMLDEYEKHRLHPFLTEGFDPLIPWVKRTGIGLTLYSPYYLDHSSFAYNPETYKKVLNRIEDLLKKYDGCFWGVSLGDEVLSVTMRTFIKRANDPKVVESDPYLKNALEIIKRDFGYGKYTVPTSLDSKNEPFHWLATRKWMLSRMMELQKDIQKLCEKYKGPNGERIVTISSDHCDWALLQHQSRMAPYFDITSAQTVPLNDSSRQTLAFRAKLLKDLTGKAVWLCAHVEPYSGNYTEQETAAFLSEVARGGGTGLQMWNYDYIGDQRKMGSSQFDYYGHPARWNTIMDCSDKFRSMNLLKFPKPDYAVFVSNDTSISRAKMTVFNYEAFFNLAGPAIGTWFKFISDIQLIDGNARLEDWPFVIIPKADVQDKKLYPLFKKYLKNGGTLLCFDPEIFSYDSDGSNLSAARLELFGANTVPHSGGNTLELIDDPIFAGINGLKPSVIGAKYALMPAPGTTVIGKYADGSSAVTVKNYPNGGRAIMFAFETEQYQVSNKQWRSFMQGILENSGAALSYKIWNFTFPHKTEKEPVFNLKCLTGNHFYWWNNEVRNVANALLPAATYSFSISPDSPKYSSGMKIPFSKGNLTNRLLAPSAGDIANSWRNKDKIKAGELKLDMFADTWTNTESFAIKFDFGQTVAIQKVKLFYQGNLPEFKIVFDNGKTFSAQGESTPGVLGKEVVFEEQQTNSMTISISKRPENQSLVLSEIEIWGAVR